MQQGLWFLWVLSAGVSLVAWLHLEISRAQNRRLQTRRPITGCELARQILDRHHLNRTSVNPASVKGKRDAGLLVDELVLAESVYYGNQLADLTQAVHETVGHLEASHSLLPIDLRTTGRQIFGMGVLLSWCLVLGGVLLDRWNGLVAGGQFLFVLAFFFALSSLGKEWEIAERAILEIVGTQELTPLLEDLGTGERVGMKRLLKAMRWAPLAELFRLPFSMIVRDKTKIKRWPVKI